MSLKILVGTLLLLAVALTLFLVISPAPDQVGGPTPAGEPSTAPTANTYADMSGSATDGASAKPADAAPNSVDIVSGSAEAQNEEVLAIQDKIIEGVVTYSEEGLPAIEPYLSHPNPEVRAQAIDGMIQISVPAAAGILRRAARDAKDPQDKVKMLEAAEFIELPNIPPDLLKKKKQEGQTN